MFGFKPSNNNGGVNVNTSLFSSYSDTCKLTIGAWNLQLSVKFHPFKGVNADGQRIYATDNTEIVNTSLTINNTIALLDAIKNEIDPAIAAKESKSVSVLIGSGQNRKMLSIETDGEEVYAVIYINVQEDGTVPNPAVNCVKHQFNKKEYMIGYNCENGTGETVAVNSEYQDFVKKLESIFTLAPAVPHSINYNNAMKASFSNRQAAANNNANPQYSAPTASYDNSDMSNFLPFS